MSTVLLVGDSPPSASRLSDSERPATRPTSPLKGALERVGYRVVSATDGAGALAQLGPHPPDVIVLAAAVPDMDLLDLCVAVRHDPAGQKTPFVLVADAARQCGRAASRAGADLTFPPTVGPIEIAERLHRLF